MTLKIEGVVVATVTPFSRTGLSVDLGKARDVAQFLLGEGCSGLFVCGSTGEGPLMALHERLAVLEASLEAAGSKGIVIAQTGAAHLGETIALTRHARDAGAHAAAVVAPHYFSYDDQALERYFSAVAKSVPGFPVLLYNIPQCTINRLSPSLVARLASRNDNLVGMKDSSGDMPAMTQLRCAVPPGFMLVNGADIQACPAFSSGIEAAVSGSANVLAPIYVSLYRHHRAGRTKEAWAAQDKLIQGVSLLQGASPVAAMKEGLRLRGVDAGWVRPPQRSLTAGERKALEKGLDALGLL